MSSISLYTPRTSEALWAISESGKDGRDAMIFDTKFYRSSKSTPKRILNDPKRPQDDAKTIPKLKD